MIRAMDDSVPPFRDAIAAFGNHLGDARLLPLGAALALHALSLLVRSGVWWGILRAGFPEQRVGLRPTIWAYLVGVGANAVAPFRGGDVVRIFAIRRHLVDAPVATIVSTLVAETAFGAVVIGAMVAGTVWLGWLPPVIHLPGANTFEFSFYARHALALAIVLVALIGGGLMLARWAAGHVRGIWLQTVQGLRILRSPGRFARVVAAPQLVDWALRVATGYAMLTTFGIPSALRLAMLVVVIDSVTTALPFTPGGVGAQQGLLMFALGGVATPGQVLSFSIGAQGVIVGFNIVLGLVAAFAMFGHMRIGSIAREAYSQI
jgi:uncharacterized membrane protein YbhN (UPF0104 family)